MATQSNSSTTSVNKERFLRHLTDKRDPWQSLAVPPHYEIEVFPVDCDGEDTARTLCCDALIRASQQDQQPTPTASWCLFTAPDVDYDGSVKKWVMLVRMKSPTDTRDYGFHQQFTTLMAASMS